jgi:hypothetical protein
VSGLQHLSNPAASWDVGQTPLRLPEQQKASGYK